MVNSKQFYECLFDKEELTVHGDNKFATKPTQAISNGIKELKPFFVINPIKPGYTRSIDGVKHFRNFMFEIDEDMDKNPVPLEKQQEIIQAAQFPWSTCVYSGGKSLHWILSLEEPVEDASEYRMWWKMMEAILNKTAKELGYNLKFDPNVKDPSRFSRAAGSVRMDVNPKAIQELRGVSGRKSQHLVMQWFDQHGVKFEDFAPKPTQFEIGKINEDAKDHEKFEFIQKQLMKNQAYQPGHNANSWQFTFARLARRCGIDEALVRFQLSNICGEVDHRDPVKSAYSDKYANDEPIYVLSKAERSAWAKHRALEDELQTKQDLIASGQEDEHLHINGVFDYIRVGTQYYKKEKDKLNPWKKETLQDDFGASVTKQFPDQLKYAEFVNLVDFVNPIENKGRKYNKFKKPDWTPEPGNWPTTERLLRKVFSEVGQDQYEEGLDWIQHQLTNPKQMLHCLIIGSESREAGKDTFVEWMRMMLGSHNIYFSDIENFLKPFNGAYADKCLIALNEVKFSSINDGSMEKIKQYITQESVVIDEKFQIPYEIDYYGKMIMLTNNVHDFMRIDDEENRFWIRTMPLLDKKKDYDPHFKTKLAAELPHFVHFILNRSLKHTEKLSRFWLPEEITHTSELQNIRENSKSSLYLEIHELLDNTFYERIGTEELFFVLSDIRERLKTDVGPKQIKMCLQKEFKLKPHKMLRKNSFTSDERNSTYFHVTKANFYEQPDTTPGLDDAFSV